MSPKRTTPPSSSAPVVDLTIRIPVVDYMHTHPNCRCVMVPVSKSWTELGYPEIDEAIANGTVEGPTVPKLGEDILRGMSVRDQQRVMGRARWTGWNGAKNRPGVPDGVGLPLDAMYRDVYHPDWGWQLRLDNFESMLTELGRRETPSIAQAVREARYPPKPPPRAYRAPERPLYVGPAVSEGRAEASEAAFRTMIATTLPLADPVVLATDDPQVETAVTKIEAALRTVLDPAKTEVRIRVPEAVLNNILTTGRVQSQFETGTSQGALSSSSRTRFEEDSFGYTHDSDVAARPIYAYVASKVGDGGDVVSSYGDVVVRLKGDALARTTVTFDDSLYSSAQALPFVEPGVAMVPTVYHLISSAPTWRTPEDAAQSVVYVEAQVHGQVTLADIAEVVFTATVPTAFTDERFSESGNAAILANAQRGIDRRTQLTTRLTELGIPYREAPTWNEDRAARKPIDPVPAPAPLAVVAPPKSVSRETRAVVRPRTAKSVPTYTPPRMEGPVATPVVTLPSDDVLVTRLRAAMSARPEAAYIAAVARVAQFNRIPVEHVRYALSAIKVGEADAAARGLVEEVANELERAAGPPADYVPAPVGLRLDRPTDPARAVVYDTALVARQVIAEVLGIPVTQNRWSGDVIIESNSYPRAGYFNWEGGLAIREATNDSIPRRVGTVVHEMLHGVGTSTPSSYSALPGWEEGVTEALTQLIITTVAERMEFDPTQVAELRGDVGYIEYTQPLNELQRLTDLAPEAFYVDLIKTPLQDRPARIAQLLEAAGAGPFVWREAFEQTRRLDLANPTQLVGGHLGRREQRAEEARLIVGLVNELRGILDIDARSFYAPLIARRGERLSSAIQEHVNAAVAKIDALPDRTDEQREQRNRISRQWAGLSAGVVSVEGAGFALAPGETDEDLTIAAKAAYKRAAVVEPTITLDVQLIGQSLGIDPDFEGMLQYRLKSEASLKRKIGNDARHTGQTFAEAAVALKDTVRYTYITTSEQYVPAYTDARAALEAKGYTHLRTKNFWSEGDTQYQGVNSVFTTPDGQHFELQFHTEASLAAKNLNHALKEIWEHPGTTDEARERIRVEMESNQRTVVDPPGVHSTLATMQGVDYVDRSATTPAGPVMQGPLVEAEERGWDMGWLSTGPVVREVTSHFERMVDLYITPVLPDPVPHNRWFEVEDTDGEPVWVATMGTDVIAYVYPDPDGQRYVIAEDQSLTDIEVRALFTGVAWTSEAEFNEAPVVERPDSSAWASLYASLGLDATSRVPYEGWAWLTDRDGANVRVAFMGRGVVAIQSPATGTYFVSDSVSTTDDFVVAMFADSNHSVTYDVRPPTPAEVTSEAEADMGPAPEKMTWGDAIAGLQDVQPGGSGVIRRLRMDASIVGWQGASGQARWGYFNAEGRMEGVYRLRLAEDGDILTAGVAYADDEAEERANRSIRGTTNEFRRQAWLDGFRGRMVLEEELPEPTSPTAIDGSPITDAALEVSNDTYVPGGWTTRPQDFPGESLIVRGTTHWALYSREPGSEAIGAWDRETNTVYQVTSGPPAPNIRDAFAGTGPLHVNAVDSAAARWVTVSDVEPLPPYVAPVVRVTLARLQEMALDEGLVSGMDESSEAGMRYADGQAVGVYNELGELRAVQRPDGSIAAVVGVPDDEVRALFAGRTAAPSPTGQVYFYSDANFRSTLPGALDAASELTGDIANTVVQMEGGRGYFNSDSLLVMWAEDGENIVVVNRDEATNRDEAELLALFGMVPAATPPVAAPTGPWEQGAWSDGDLQRAGSVLPMSWVWRETDSDIGGMLNSSNIPTDGPGGWTVYRRADRDIVVWRTAGGPTGVATITPEGGAQVIFKRNTWADPERRATWFFNLYLDRIRYSMNRPAPAPAPVVTPTFPMDTSTLDVVRVRAGEPETPNWTYEVNPAFGGAAAVYGLRMTSTPSLVKMHVRDNGERVYAAWDGAGDLLHFAVRHPDGSANVIASTSAFEADVVRGFYVQVFAAELAGGGPTRTAPPPTTPDPFASVPAPRPTRAAAPVPPADLPRDWNEAVSSYVLDRWNSEGEHPIDNERGFTNGNDLIASDTDNIVMLGTYDQNGKLVTLLVVPLNIDTPIEGELGIVVADPANMNATRDAQALRNAARMDGYITEATWTVASTSDLIRLGSRVRVVPSTSTVPRTQGGWAALATDYDFNSTMVDAVAEGLVREGVIGDTSEVLEGGPPDSFVLTEPYDSYGSMNAAVIYYNPDGVAVAVAHIGVDPGDGVRTAENPSALKANSVHYIKVHPSFRRLGLATRIYEWATLAGLKIEEESGKHGLTSMGERYWSARRAKPLSRISMAVSRMRPELGDPTTFEDVIGLRTNKVIADATKKLPGELAKAGVELIADDVPSTYKLGSGPYGKASPDTIIASEQGAATVKRIIPKSHEVIGRFEGGAEPSQTVEMDPTRVTVADVDFAGAYSVRRNQQDAVVTTLVGDVYDRLGLPANGVSIRVEGIDPSRMREAFDDLGTMVPMATMHESTGLIEYSAYNTMLDDETQRAWKTFATKYGGTLNVLPAHIRWYWHDASTYKKARKEWFNGPEDASFLADDIKRAALAAGDAGRAKSIRARRRRRSVPAGPAGGGDSAQSGAGDAAGVDAGARVPARPVAAYRGEPRLDPTLRIVTPEVRDFAALAALAMPVVERFTGGVNVNWTGRVAPIDPANPDHHGATAVMDWDGTLLVDVAQLQMPEDHIVHVLVHELLHALSGVTPEQLVSGAVWLEEGLVEALARQITPEVLAELGMAPGRSLSYAYENEVQSLLAIATELDIPFRTFLLRLIEVELDDRLLTLAEWARERGGVKGLRLVAMRNALMSPYSTGAGARDAMLRWDAMQRALDIEPSQWWFNITADPGYAMRTAISWLMHEPFAQTEAGRAVHALVGGVAWPGKTASELAMDIVAGRVTLARAPVRAFPAMELPYRPGRGPGRGPGGDEEEPIGLEETTDPAFVRQRARARRERRRVSQPRRAALGRVARRLS